MKGMVLAAGVGSRLEPLTKYTPKPMVPLGNRPAMEHILALLARHSITEIATNLWYLPEQIKTYFGNGSGFGVNLYYSEEKELLGTAGGVRKLADFFDETFIVIAGDALTDVDLTGLVNFHRERGALATIAVKPVEDPTHYGVVVTDEQGKITGFQEKPKLDEALSFTANTGIYVFEPEVLELIPADTFYDFGKQLFPRLVADKAPFYAWATEDYWCDVGTHQVYYQANLDIVRGRVRLYTAGFRQPEGGLLVAEGAEIAACATLSGTNVIGENCRVESGVKLSDSVLWDRVTVGERAQVEGAVLGQGVTVLPGAKVPRGCIIGDGSVIGSQANLAEGTVVPAESNLK
ncbi:MAG: NDP-sugar synthase [Firmicutes bacterium]|nr:NDP-sugar synthase [Bacillota bacterium]